MNITALIINAIALVGIVFAFAKNRQKAMQALKIAVRSFLKILPMTLVIVLAIGLLLGIISSEQISAFIGEQAGFGGVLLVAVVGAFMHIPALLSFPLAASLLVSGAQLTAVAAFITTLTMIGMLTLPLEIKELGIKMALLRNGISFVIAVCIAFIMGMIL